MSDSDLLNRRSTVLLNLLEIVTFMQASAMNCRFTGIFMNISKSICPSELSKLLVMLLMTDPRTLRYQILRISSKVFPFNNYITRHCRSFGRRTDLLR